MNLTKAQEHDGKASTTGIYCRPMTVHRTWKQSNLTAELLEEPKQFPTWWSHQSHSSDLMFCLLLFFFFWPFISFLEQALLSLSFARLSYLYLHWYSEWYILPFSFDVLVYTGNFYGCVESRQQVAASNSAKFWLSQLFRLLHYLLKTRLVKYIDAWLHCRNHEQSEARVVLQFSGRGDYRCSIPQGVQGFRSGAQSRGNKTQLALQ